MESIIHNSAYDSQYQKLLTSVIEQAKATRFRTSVGVNQQLIRLYWFIGEEITRLKIDTKWGSKFFTQLSHDLMSAFPDMKGFSTRNLQYIKQMYDTFSSITITPQVVAQIGHTNSVVDYVSLVPWGHIRFILDKKFGPDKSFFYILKTIEHGWSRNMLLNMMAAELYESEGKAINNFPTTLPKDDSDYATEMLRNPYHLDFLNLNNDFKEKELQKGLEDNISRFLIELGAGFAYVGRQIRLEINGDEFFCDLLFYHLRLRRYIVVELKTGKFEPEYVSKLNLYCTAVDHLFKTDLDGDTIGLLFCKEKNDLVAQWTVEKNEQPIAITRYELKKLLPK